MLIDFSLDTNTTHFVWKPILYVNTLMMRTIIDTIVDKESFPFGLTSSRAMTERGNRF